MIPARWQRNQPFKTATMHRQGYLLEIAPSFQSWFFCFFDQRIAGLGEQTKEPWARDFYWCVDLLKQGHSLQNYWAALGPWQGLRQLYCYYRGTSIGCNRVTDDEIVKHIAAAMANGRLEVHRVFDPHDAYRAWASGVGSSTTASSDGQAESKPQTKKIASGTASSNSSAEQLHESATVSTTATTRKGEPKNLDEALMRLEQAKIRIRENGGKLPEKFTDDELYTMASSTSSVNNRFLVRFSPQALDGEGNPIDPAMADSPLGHVREESGRHPLWLSTFEMMEYADTDPELIAALFGTKYDPQKPYVLYIIDRGDNPETTSDAIIPTWENIIAKLTKEFSADFSPEEVKEVMNEEYAAQFRAEWDAFGRHLEDEGQHWTKCFNEKSAKDFAASHFSNDAEKGSKFINRHKILAEVGAFEIFTGRGYTERYDQPGRPGALEVLDIQNSSQAESTKSLIASGRVKAIVMPPRSQN